jgi:3-methyl-2-oxobutanoate hydroxymethyltransferase
MQHTLTSLRRCKASGEKVVMLTCYDASFATLLDEAGVECLLVGDSLGNVIQGRSTTLPVTLEQTIYHVECVARGAPRAMVIGDLPFGTFQISPQSACANAAKVMAAGAHMVKLEGGMPMLETVRFLTERGIPVCGHVGLTPQSVHAFGGFRVQGKEEEDRRRILAEARALAEAGAAMIVLEAVPESLAAEISAGNAAITIGIGAGAQCDGQVLVLYDLLDIYPGKKARFVKNFMAQGGTIRDAVRRYVEEVKARTFPAAEHVFR